MKHLFPISQKKKKLKFGPLNTDRTYLELNKKMLIVAILFFVGAHVYGYVRIPSMKPRLTLITKFTPNEVELLSESHFLSRLNGFVLEIIPTVAQNYLKEGKQVNWSNPAKVEEYLKSLTSDKVAIQPPAFVSTENFLKVMEEEDAHYLGNQSIINSISQIYLPEIDVEEYEEFNVLITGYSSILLSLSISI